MELKKMEMKSASGNELNLEALYQIMPSAFTEVCDDKTGEIAHKINFNTLRELLGDNAYEGADEEYGFKWVGKNAARREAARAINKTLRPCPEESVDWDNTQNLYIEGDNLEVLKLLQKSYLGKVKMIYIDPPYNTGNDFVYRDDFAMDKDGYDRAAGDVDELGNRFRKNADGNARFHSDWCSMIYERLLVTRSLLTNDGVIFISIDDNEVENLKKICDEVFGGCNFIAQLTTVMNLKGNNDQFGFAGTHEYTLVYAKSLLNIQELNGISLTVEDYADYTEQDEFGKYKIGATLMRTGEAGFRIKRPKGYYPIYVSCDYTSFDITRHSDTDIVVYPTTKEGIEMSWRRSPDNLHQTRNEFIIKKTSNGISFYKKQRLEEDMKRGKKPKTLFYKPEYSSGNGTGVMKDLFNGRIFDNPKPIALITDFVKIASNDNSLILDFFSGSATTAHAVMQLNADDGGNRKFIMVQLPEKTDEKSEAYKAGYKNICEIGKERIRRAGKKIKEEFGSKAEHLDIGFRVFKCEESFMNDVYLSPANLKQEELFSHVSNIKDGTSDLSLLFGCMLDWGVQLSLPLSSFEVGDKTIYNVNDGDLVACFAEDINEDIITAIAEIEPLRVVFRDSCFSDAPLKMNLFELFKQKCGWSEEQVKSRVHVI